MTFRVLGSLLAAAALCVSVGACDDKKDDGKKDAGKKDKDKGDKDKGDKDKGDKDKGDKDKGGDAAAKPEGGDAAKAGGEAGEAAADGAAAAAGGDPKQGDKCEGISPADGLIACEGNTIIFCSSYSKYVWTKQRDCEEGTKCVAEGKAASCK